MNFITIHSELKYVVYHLLDLQKILEVTEIRLIAANHKGSPTPTEQVAFTGKL